MEVNSTIADDAKRVFSQMPEEALQQMFTYLYYGSDITQSLGYQLAELDSFFTSQIIIAVHSSARISSAIVVFLLLFLVAQNYRSLLFIIYQINFLLMIISSALELAWVFSFTGSLTGYMTSMTGSSYGPNVSMAASVFTTLLMLSLLATLALQIYVAFSDTRKRTQIAATLVAALACFPAYFVIIWRLAAVGITLFGSRHGMGAFGSGFFISSPNEPDIKKYTWAFEGAWRAFAASVSFLSLMLCVKFFMVNRRRAKMGLVRFDPVKILFTMALQNSVIPSILAIVSASIGSGNQGGQSISASAIPVCACMLPIGFIWAQYQTHAKTVPASDMPSKLRLNEKTSDIRDDYSELSTARFGERFDDDKSSK